MQTWIDLKFPDGGNYTFRLPVDAIREIETKCGGGIGEVAGRLYAGRFGLGVNDIMPHDAKYRVDDLITVIKLGLIYGKGGRVDGQDVIMTPTRASELVERYIWGMGYDRQPLKQSWAFAAVILDALIEGFTPPKKDVPGESPATETNV